MSLALHVHPIPAPVCLHNVVMFLFGSGIQYTAQPLCIMSEGKLPKFHVSFVWLALGFCLTPPPPFLCAVRFVWWCCRSLSVLVVVVGAAALCVQCLLHVHVLPVLSVLRGSVHLLRGGSAHTVCAFLKGL